MQKITLKSKVRFLEERYKRSVGKLLDPPVKQKDLTYIEFVLVSSGINENFDAFPKQRLAGLKKLVDQDKIFISVETFFSDWDYLLVEKNEVIKRDASQKLFNL